MTVYDFFPTGQLNMVAGLWLLLYYGIGVQYAVHVWDRDEYDDEWEHTRNVLIFFATAWPVLLIVDAIGAMCREDSDEFSREGADPEDE